MRRSGPLKRRKPLKARKPWLPDRKPLRSVSRTNSRRRAYNAALRSPHTRAVKLETHIHDNWTCVWCGRGPFEAGDPECTLDHLTYERLGRERLGDCVTACASCNRSRRVW